MRFWHLILFLVISGPLLAQGEIDEQSRLFWRNERSIGAALNSNGWSVIYRDLRQLKPSHRYFIEGSFEGFKDPKEIKMSNYYFPGYGSYVYGKLNSTWTLGAAAGYQIEIFEKRDLGGVSISWFGCTGATLLFAKPIYYEVAVSVGNNYYALEEDKFDVALYQPLEIVGKASFFRGFDEIKLYPGLYARSGFSFEYSKKDRVTHAIEIGGSFHAFIKDIPIMDNDLNKQFFPSIFVSYRIGMILDPIKPEGLFDIFRRKTKE